MGLLKSMNIELKRECTDDISVAVVAFANTEGGKIYIGVDEDGTTEGVYDVDQTILQAGKIICNSVVPDITSFIDCYVEERDSVSVIVLEVQRGSAGPYYLRDKGFSENGVYVRKGFSSVLATTGEIQEMVQRCSSGGYEDFRSLNQELTFRETEKELEKIGVTFDAEKKKEIGLLKDDGTLSNLALLLSDQCKHTIKIAAYEGVEKAEMRDKTECTGSLFAQLQQAYGFIDRYNKRRKESDSVYESDSIYAKEVRDYPIEAVREALLNAMLHRDYSLDAAIMISVFHDRLEFVSPGGLPKGLTEADLPMGLSVLRNKKLFSFFSQLKLTEGYGTGIVKIMRHYPEYGMRAEIQTTENAFKLTLPSADKSVGDAWKRTTLTENETAVLKLFEEKDVIVRKDIEEALSISQPMAVRILKQMTDKKVIQRLGDGKNIRYQIM